MLLTMKNLLIILIISVLFSACSKVKEEEKDNKVEEKKSENTETVILSKESQEKIELKTETIKVEQYNSFIKIPAVVITDQDFEAQVGPIVPGRVKKVYANVGSYVSAGQTLMLIEGLDIGVLKADFLKAKTTLSYTEQEFNRQKLLSEQNAGSQKNLISSKAEYEKALAEFIAMDKKIHSVGLKDEDILNDNNEQHTAGDLSVKSPISGTIVERNVVVGQYIESSFIAFKIANTKSLLVDGQIYENDFYKLDNTKSAEFKTPSLPDEIFLCNINFKGQAIDEKTRTIKIRAKINNPRNKLLPQMFGELIVKSGESKKGIFIPSSSVYKDNEENFVFIQENDSTFKLNHIKIGLELDDKVEIISGLNQNDKIVINGVFELKSEMQKESFGEGE